MKMVEVRAKAKVVGLKVGKMKKYDLIKAIQTKEGNYACFGSAADQCVQQECCWRSDCLTN